MTIRGVLAVLCATAAAGAAMKIETSDEHKSEEHEELNAELSRLVRAPSPLGVDGVVPSDFDSKSEFGAQNNGVKNHNQSPQGALGGGGAFGGALGGGGAFGGALGGGGAFGGALGDGNGNAASILLNCDFDSKSAACETESRGLPWNTNNYGGAQGNVIFSYVGAGKYTTIRFQQVIQPPAGGIICLSFSYMRYENKGNKVVPLMSVLRPVSGRGEAYSFPITTNDKGKFLTAQLNLTELKHPVQVLFYIAVPASAQGQETVVAVDDIKLTDRKC